jgi:hypothetical protein
MEVYYGTPLFDRLGKRVALTPAGEILLAASQEVTVSIENAEQRIDDLTGLRGGKLVLGTSFPIGVYVLPRVLARIPEELSGSGGRAGDISQREDQHRHPEQQVRCWPRHSSRKRSQAAVAGVYVRPAGGDLSGQPSVGSTATHRATRPARGDIYRGGTDALGREQSWKSDSTRRDFTYKKMSTAFSWRSFMNSMHWSNNLP